MVVFHELPSARSDAWSEGTSATDALPVRASGRWIERKHAILEYFGHLFATGMKNRWEQRVYIELFAGPGRCAVRDSAEERDGSPVIMARKEFTQMKFVEIQRDGARALETRLAGLDLSARVEIWNGDCAEAIQHITFPPKALTFAFIDPTGIGHAPFSLIRDLRQKTRCDILINIQHGMGIKMNIHQYTPDAEQGCALTRFVGDESWKAHCGKSPRDFFLGVLGEYKKRLDGLGFSFIGREVLVRNDSRTPLYLLLFASGNPRGEEFWGAALKGTDAQRELPLGGA